MVYRQKPFWEGTTKNVTFGNGLTVPVAEKAYKYSAMPDCNAAEEAVSDCGDRYYFEERGINEKNTAISATNSMGQNEFAAEVDALVPVGICEDIILTLILPQVETAEKGVMLLGWYVENYGASECAGIQFCDENEAWYMEICGGHSWIAVRIPDDKCAVIANCMVIHGVDLQSPDVKHSANLFKTAKLICNNPKVEVEPDINCFNSSKIFGFDESMKDRTDLYYNIDRLWAAQRFLTGEDDLEPRRESQYYPLFITPKEKLSASHIAYAMRLNYSGTPIENADPKPSRPIGVTRNQELHIITFLPNLQKNLKGIMWQSLSAISGTIVIPVFAVAENYPQEYAFGDNNNFSKDSAYWVFRTLFALSDALGEDVLQNLLNYNRKTENEYFSECNDFINLLETCDYDKAVRFAADFSFGLLHKYYGNCKALLDNLVMENIVNQKDL
jgi:dipeptidase